jgi:hypothetical protein
MYIQTMREANIIPSVDAYNALLLSATMNRGSGVSGDEMTVTKQLLDEMKSVRVVVLCVL